MFQSCFFFSLETWFIWPIMCIYKVVEWRSGLVCDSHSSVRIKRPLVSQAPTAESEAFECKNPRLAPFKRSTGRRRPVALDSHSITQTSGFSIIGQLAVSLASVNMCIKRIYVNTDERVGRRRLRGKTQHAKCKIAEWSILVDLLFFCLV